GAGRYSHWNGRASAMPGAPLSAPVTRTFAMATFGDADAQQRLLKRRAGGGQIGWLVGGGLQRPLGLTARLLRALEVDVAREVGVRAHDDDFVGRDLQEAADDGEGFLGAALANPQLAHTERRDQGRV